ncbi:MAG TPA: HAMP domain-containing sensor histidine kinase [Armatimonadota bacterium]|nr:HAMP domain-containing sensor histidine kinase [Armatimonadota bacterium]
MYEPGDDECAAMRGGRPARACGRAGSGEGCALHGMQHGILAAVSHELLTPLTAMQGYLSLLARGELGALTAEQVAAVQVALANADRLHQLMTDLLDYASLARDALALDQEPLELAETLAGAVRRVSRQAAARRVPVRHRLPAALGVVIGDRQRLERAFEHLLDNAVKFSAPGQSVRLSVARRGAAVRVTVRDQGIGMSAEVMRGAFIPFAQGDTGLTRQYAGLGIGLPLVEKLITLHGGRLSIRSAHDRGTAVTVTLPLHPPSPSSSPSSSSS